MLPFTGAATGEGLMMNMLADGSQWLADTMKASASSLVEYRRGEESSFVQAVFGRTEAEISDESGITINAFVNDFLILADDLADEPEAGDVIVADGRKYEVLDLGNEGVWRWSDNYKNMMRIHTKDIGTDD